MHRFLQLLTLLAAGFGATGLVAAPKTLAGENSAKVDYTRDIQPLLESRCLECHGPKKQKSTLRVDMKPVLLKGGDSGKAAIVPGKSAESLLILKVLSKDPDEMMPPKGDRLSTDQVALLKTWIDQGAPMPEDLAGGGQKAHWAYIPPVRPPVPKVKNKSWCRNGIDFFVASRLEKERLKPSPEADKAVLFRRASLDLTGLPPTLEELERFLTDKRKDAYELAVERLLDSPHYGERWARPWLDLARYADTQGYEKDNRRTVWPFRDWVIRALNDNMHFDEFTIEQLAGDLLPGASPDQKVATGFHRNTMTNTEGGTDNEEFRYEAVVDRVNTTMAVWMGTTFACAQCHNHKYDPITTKEYYQLMSFLNSTRDADSDDESPTMKVFKPGQETKLAKLREAAKLAEKSYNEAVKQPEITTTFQAWEQQTTASLTNWFVLDPKEFASAGGATLIKTESKSIHATGHNPSNDTYTITAALPAGMTTGFRLEVLENGKDKTLGRHTNGGFVLKGFEAALQAGSEARLLKYTKAAADFSQKNFEIGNVISGKGDGWAVEQKNRVRHSAWFTLSKPLELAQETNIVFTLRHSEKNPFANIERFRLSATSSKTVGPALELPEDVQKILLTSADKRDEKQKTRLTDYFYSIAPELKKPRAEMAAAKKAEKDYFDAIPITSVMAELEKPRKTHRHMRGTYLSLGEEVTPGTPAAFNPFPTNEPPNRLGLARWLVATNNPLTARVIMNRFWEQYFGKGIVETVEEFGKQGEAPSHPELLDWLATEFMRVGWDMKAMHKLIVTSATYCQSSKASPDLLAKDPYNRLLARGPRVRLEAEMIRDQALTVSGLLSHKIGGPSVMPPQPEGLWQVVYSGDKWVTSPGDDKYRRGLYTFWRRTTPHPMMASFDAPSREYCVLKRSRSNTPLQALNILNDPAFVEAAQALARKIAARSSSDLNERVTFAFRTCLSRVPKQVEVDRLVTLYQTQLANYRQDTKAAIKMASSEIGKPPPDADLAELAAWTVVANVLLNLDEIITKG